jgi:hypothetical protein
MLDTRPMADAWQMDMLERIADLTVDVEDQLKDRYLGRSCSAIFISAHLRTVDRLVTHLLRETQLPRGRPPPVPLGGQGVLPWPDEQLRHGVNRPV